MKTTKTLTTLTFLFALLLTSCAGGHRNSAGPGAGIGAGIGAALGQAIGHNTEATLIGAIAGGLLGYITGNEIDKYDQQQLNHTYERGVSGQTSIWNNPDYGQRRVTPQPSYPGPNGQPCRNAQISAMIDGHWQTVNQTACRDPYGNWQLQSKHQKRNCTRDYTRKDRAECRAKQGY